MIFRTIAVVGMAAILAAASPMATLAHGPQGGTGQGYMMGPGMMMGPGYGHMMGQGDMMGPGMMGPGMMDPNMMGLGMQAPDRNLDADDVTAILKGRLAWSGNKRLKLGKVAAKDDNTILAEIVTVDGSLVEKLSVDRKTGRMTRVE